MRSIYLIFFLLQITINLIWAELLLKLFANNQQKIADFGKPSAGTWAVFQFLKKFPISNAKKIAQQCSISLPTANKSLKQLLDLKIVIEATGKSRNKLYVYQDYLDILNEGSNH
jgi:Fic family protein